MSGKLVLLFEELTAAEFARELIPRLVPGTVDEVDFQCVPHQGKNDLARSIPRKLRGWREPGVRFLEVQDQDSADCHELKRRLRRICEEAGRPDTIIRIAVRELEAWIAGELSAVARAFNRPEIERYSQRASFRDPDAMDRPSRRIQDLVSDYGKVDGARRIGALISLDRNRSRSFQLFASAVTHLMSDREQDASDPS